MKRFLVVFAVLVPLSFFVAGCGGSGGSSSSKSGQLSPDQQKQMQEAMMKQKAKEGGTPGAPAK
jgi:hypothetical protein